jgi:hypothetical protein
MGVDADPGVGHAGHNVRALVARRDRDPSAAFGVLGGVVEKVGERLGDAREVCIHP